MRLEAPSWWYGERIPLAARALWPLSVAYGALVKRRFSIASPYRSALPVICVGNFTMGGAGKTPVALKLASMLRAARMRPGFLTRGYGGSERSAHLIDAGADGAERVGDEPLLLARAAPAVASRDRPEGARLLETQAIDVIIMDDGFQNPSLEKDFSVVVVDAGVGLGCGHVFPLGPLRAPLAFQLARAHAVIVLGGEDRTNAAALLEQKSRGLLNPAPVFNARIAPGVTADMQAGRFVAFCGIGRPGKFFDTLREGGVAVAKELAFPDHHPFTEADASSLLTEAKALNARLITTEKDRARLSHALGALSELYRCAVALPIDVVFTEGSETRLLNLLQSAMRAPEPLLRRKPLPMPAQ